MEQLSPSAIKKRIRRLMAITRTQRKQSLSGLCCSITPVHLFSVIPIMSSRMLGERRTRKPQSSRGSILVTLLAFLVGTPLLLQLLSSSSSLTSRTTCAAFVPPIRNGVPRHDNAWITSQTAAAAEHVRQVRSRSRRNSRRLFATPETGQPPKASAAATTDANKTPRTKNFKHNSQQHQQRGPRRNNTNNNTGGQGGRKNVLWNQKRLNQRLVSAESANELFQHLQEATGALTKTAGGGVLNTVNFSTSIHRVARHSLQNKARPAILADFRLALLVAGIAEAVVQHQEDDDGNDDDDDENGDGKKKRKLKFSSREIANISWALAKLRIAPPSSAMPIGETESSSSERLLAVAKELRQEIITASKAAKLAGEPLKPVWIALLSKLTGMLLDEISVIVNDDAMFQNFAQQEMSNLLWAWATADRASPAIFDRCIRQMIKNSGGGGGCDDREETTTIERRPQEWSNAVWAFATARVYDGYEELLTFLAGLTNDTAFCRKFKPQEISNTVWGAATLFSNLENENIPPEAAQAVLQIIRAFVPCILEKIEYFKTQELSNTLWGLATLGFGLTLTPELSANNYIVLPSAATHEDKYEKDQVVAAISGASRNRLHQFQSQELNNMAWSLARLLDECPPPVERLLEGIGMELCNPRRRVTGQDIGTTVWSFATLEYFDEDIYRRLVSRFTPQVARECKPQELSNTLWALATAEIDVGAEKDAFDTTFLPQDWRPAPRDPVTFCFGLGAMKLLQRPDSFKPQEIKDVLWSFSKLCFRHPELFRGIAEHLVGGDDDEKVSSPPRGLSEFSPQGLGNLAWAFARQAQLVEEASERNKAQAMSYANGRLAVKSACYFDIGEDLLHRLFRAIAETDLHVHNGLSDLRPQDISNTAWTFGLLGIYHDGFVEACKNQLQQRTSLYLSGREDSSTYFKGQEISNLLWALSSLNSPADELIASSVGPYLQKICQNSDGKLTSASIANMFNRQELANIAWSCAVNDVYPPDLMTFLYGGLLGDQKDPVGLSKVYNDAGLQNQAMMTLLYVQAAMNLKKSTNGLSLPDEFPDGWQQRTSRLGHDDVIAPTFELSLSTSRIQRSVSEAFRRIGFDHVEEHTISMEGLASEYGVNVALKPVEVLSIDIANVPGRIAIEVDGPAHYVNHIDKEGDAAGFTKVVKGKLEYQFGWTGNGQTINGPTALKERLLNSLGWTVIHLPFWDLRFQDKKEEEDYCRSLLQQYSIEH